MIQNREASEYFLLASLKRFGQINNFETLKQRRMSNAVMNYIYSCSLEDATTMKQLAPCYFSHNSLKFIYPDTLVNFMSPTSGSQHKKNTEKQSSTFNSIISQLQLYSGVD